MFAAVFKSLAVIVIYAVVSGFAAWNGAEILGRYGVFGSGYESGKELGIIFIAFPALWLASFMLLFFIRDWSLGSLFDGWRGFAFAVGAWLGSCVAFFVWMLTRP